MDPADAQFTPTYLAYAGELIALVSSQLAAAYATVHAIESAVIFLTSGTVLSNNQFYFLYAGYSSTFDLWGLWELIVVFMFITWALGISITGYVEAAFLWEKYETLELAGKTITMSEGFKYLALGMLIGGGTWISGLALGDSANHMLRWFDEKED